MAPATIIASLLLGSLVGPLHTSTVTALEQPTSMRPAASAAAAWTLDPIHSMALFRIQHLKSGMFWGRLNALAGTVVLDPSGDAAPQFDVTASLDQIDTGSEKLDGNLKGPNFFNAKEFPTLNFKSTSGERVSATTWRVTGEMTIRGQVRSVTVDVEMTGVGGTPVEQHAGFEARCTIKRSDFGMTWGIEKPAAVLSDDVQLIVSLEGIQQSGA